MVAKLSPRTVGFLTIYNTGTGVRADDGGESEPSDSRVSEILKKLGKGLGQTVVVKAEPSDYLLPIGQTAVIMIDFQKDFMEEGGFGAALGNNVSLLKVGRGACTLNLKHASV